MGHCVNLVVPDTDRNSMRHAYMRLSLKNLMPSFRQPMDQNDVTGFFSERYKDNNIERMPVLDGTTEWYLRPLEYCGRHFADLSDTPETLALDIGCGAASVGKWLRHNGYKWSYVGVDIAKSAGNHFRGLENSGFVHKNALHLLPEDLPKKPDIIFAVNSLCYIHETKAFLTRLAQLGHDKTKLVILDGYPAPFWNKKIPSKNYSTFQMGEMLEQRGWHTEKVFRLSLHHVVKFPVMTISHGFLCSRG